MDATTLTSLTPSAAIQARTSFNERNDCAIVAFVNVTGVPYVKAHAVFKALGRRRRCGTAWPVTWSALKTYTENLEDVTDQYKSKTLRTLERELPSKGRFIIRVTRHLAAYVDGELLDWAAGKTKRVQKIFRISPKGEGETTMAKKTAAKTSSKTKAAPKKKKKATNPKAAPAAKKDDSGLRKPQIRILKYLKDGKPRTRQIISEKAPVDQASLVEYIGSHDDAKRKANDKKHFPSLITLGYVKAAKHDVNGKDTVVYTITANGKKKAAAV